MAKPKRQKTKKKQSGKGGFLYSKLAKRLLVIGVSLSFLIVAGIGIDYANRSGWLKPVYAFYWTASQQLGLVVKEVEPIQLSYGDPQQLLNHANIEIGTPMFSLDLKAIHRTLLNNGWVEQAIVKRIWPNRIAISVKERIPVATWQYQRKFYLIDANGETIASKPPERFNQLPVIVGASAPQHVDELLQILDEFPQISRRFQAASYVSKRYWALTLQGSSQGPLTIRLPDQAHLNALANLVELFETKNLDWQKFSLIDLRLPDRITFRPRILPASAN